MRETLIEPETQFVSLADNLNITASKRSSPDDFDFLVGKWKVHNKKLAARLNDCDDWTEFETVCECRKILNGCGNIDTYRTEFDGVPFEEMTVRIFNPATGLWSIYWADTNRFVLDVPVVGSFDGDSGCFYARDEWEEREVILKFLWNKANPETPIWKQAFSADEGKSWEWNRQMIFYRQS